MIIVYTKNYDILFYTAYLLETLSHLIIKGLLVSYYSILSYTPFRSNLHVLFNYIKLHCFMFYK